MPKVRYFVFCQAVVSLGQLGFQHLAVLGPDVIEAVPSEAGMRMLCSKLSASAAMLTKENSKCTELSKKLRKLHHSSKMAVLSSCNASW